MLKGEHQTLEFCFVFFLNGQVRKRTTAGYATLRCITEFHSE